MSRVLDLNGIAERIRNRHARAMRDIIDTGHDLRAAKEQLGHGKFGAWLQSACFLSERSARNYMLAAEVFGSKSATIADLPPATVYKLAALATPPVVRERVLADLEAGQAITPIEIECRIKDAKPNHQTTHKPRTRGASFDPQASSESQHDRDLRMLAGMWEGCCATAKVEFAKRMANWLPPVQEITKQDLVVIAAPTQAVAAPMTAAKILFEQGVALLKSTGRSETTARGLLGAWKRDYGEGAVIEALSIAQRNEAPEPVAYITKILRGKNSKAGAMSAVSGIAAYIEGQSE